jgi:hypothetical protein
MDPTQAVASPTRPGAIAAHDWQGGQSYDECCATIVRSIDAPQTEHGSPNRRRRSRLLLRGLVEQARIPGFRLPLV